MEPRAHEKYFNAAGAFSDVTSELEDSSDAADAT